MVRENRQLGNVKGAGKAHLSGSARLIRAPAVLRHLRYMLLCEKELRIGHEPTRKAPCRLGLKGGDVEHCTEVFSLPFVVSVRSEVGLGSRSLPPRLPIRTHRLEGPGRSLERLAECDFTNHGWIS